MKKYFCFLFCLFLSFPLKAQTDVIKQVFENLKQDYIVQTNNKEIALKGLRVLKEVDKNIDLKASSDKIFLYQNGKVVDKFEMPSDAEDVNAWVDFCKKIISAGVQVSEKLDVLDFELPDRFARNVFEGLDGYSHYFATFAGSEETPFKAKRQFASRIEDEVLLIRILSFQKDVSERVKTAIEECSVCKGLILDLRGNHGGFFDEAIKLANLFLDEGIVAYTLSAEDASPQYYTAEAGDILQGKPMVVLVDGLTASAAEVLAASLSEQNRATLIGTKTYGKGTVQEVKKMEGERAMAVTTSFFYTPSGIKIDRIGVAPSICTGSTEACEKEDRLNKEEDIERAVRFIKTGV
ncbi:MAG TPA: hypothetical protein DIC64_04770 [Alphaproteobacteria bacterium]|nr:hypothetical protein [Alphaproteobacteria bacterium]